MPRNNQRYQKAKKGCRKASLFCDPGGVRTHDPQIRNLLLYPTELPDLLSAAKVMYFYNFPKK